MSSSARISSARPGRAAAVALLVTWALVGSPARASVTFFSDRSIEDVAGRLELPDGAVAHVPATLEGRAAELELLVSAAEAARAEVEAREPAVFASVPDLMERVAAVQAVPLSAEERTALFESGLAALGPDRAAALAAAGEGLATANQGLREYFVAYDAFQRSSIRARILGTSYQALEGRAQLEGHLSARRLRKLDDQLGRYLEAERRFRIFADHPSAKNHHKALSAIVCQRRGGKLLRQLELALGKAGLAPRPTWRARWARLAGEIRQSVRVAALGVACLPAAARVLGYLYNPFRKQGDPAKAVKALRSFSRAFQLGTGMKLEVAGRENVPQDHPVIFAFSHRSEVEDAVLMMGSTPGQEYSFMMGQWAFPGFLSTKLAEDPTAINVGGKHADGTPVDAVGESVQTLKDGRNLVIFPEGMTPTDQGETQELRRGIDVIARAVSKQPVSIVGVTLADPANRPGGPRNASLGGDLRVGVRFHPPMDPLKLGALPGAGDDLVRNLLRAAWHRDLFAAQGSSVDEIELPASPGARFQDLHAREE